MTKVPSRNVFQDTLSIILKELPCSANKIFKDELGSTGEENAVVLIKIVALQKSFEKSTTKLELASKAMFVNTGGFHVVTTLSVGSESTGI